MMVEFAFADNFEIYQPATYNVLVASSQRCLYFGPCIVVIIKIN